MATHSSVLAWRIPGTVEPGGLPSVGSHRVRHDGGDLAVTIIPFSRGSSKLRNQTHISWTASRVFIVWATREAVKVKVTLSCPILCNPMNYRVRGILQARIPQWVVVPISRRSSQSRDRTKVSHTAGRLFTSWAECFTDELIWGLGSAPE